MPGAQIDCPSCGAKGSKDRYCGECGWVFALPEEDKAGWFYSSNNRDKSGPFTLLQLRALAQEGKLRQADMIFRPENPKWVPAKTISGLFNGTELPQELNAADPSDAGAEWDLWDPGYALYLQFWQLLKQPVLQVIHSASNADGWDTILSSREPAKVIEACSAGLDNVSALVNDEALPTHIRTGFLHLAWGRNELLRWLEAPTDAVRATLAEIQQLRRSGSWFEQVIGHVSKQSASNMAAGGELVGQFLLGEHGRFLGNLAGRLLNFFLDDSRSEDGERQALQRLDNVTDQLWLAVEHLGRAAWDRLAEAIQVTSGEAIPRTSFFDDADRRWSELELRLQERLDPETTAWAWDELWQFHQQWGAHPSFIDNAVRLCLTPYADDLKLATAWADCMLELFPLLPATYENRAQVSLEFGQFKECLAFVESGLGIDPTYENLVLLRVEALAALGRGGEVVDSVAANEALTERGGWVRHVRGIFRSRQFRKAAWAARDWALKFRTFAGVAYTIRQDPLMGKDPYLLEAVPEFANLMHRVDWELQGAVESLLDVDGVDSCWGDPSDEMITHLAPMLPVLSRDERLLYFVDLSKFHGETTALLLTTRRLTWRTRLGQINSAELLNVPANRVTSEGSILFLADQTINVHDADLAPRLGIVLTDLAGIVHRISPNSRQPSHAVR